MHDPKFSSWYHNDNGRGARVRARKRSRHRLHETLMKRKTRGLHVREHVAREKGKKYA